MDIYVVLVGLLMVLAFFDLLVGVANDAVNFLNSAIGSQVATLRTILIIASIGVLIGALFSGGMMEVARKGIFDPQYFTFLDIMIIFLAVMFTDIILLDIFNTYGLPTSTTVSIVFEILGAAIMVAAFKSWERSGGLDLLGQYIQSERAMTIIISIFMSVAIAFTFGIIIQSIVRLGLTRTMSKHGALMTVFWSALSLTGMVYFLFFKGFKAVSWIGTDFLQWLQNNLWLCLGGLFTLFLVTLISLKQWLKINPLKLVVLTGTFGLAMAFASNDLVNFIGPAVTALSAYAYWSVSGVAADSFMMTDLAGKAFVNPLILIGAGIIMVLALWFSKKARTVTETEVGLGRQQGGKEKFKINTTGRFLVTAVLKLGAFSRYLPSSWAPQHISTQYTRTKKEDTPAFDLVRASVNLTVASVLIASATALKLPLSTTYVTFMVAMGSSLADQAWGRDIAVYRVSGVVSVIGGWFLTALSALTGAALLALVLVKLGLVAGLGLIILMALLVYVWTYRTYQRRTAREAHKHAQSALIKDALNGSAFSVLTHLQKGKTVLNTLMQGLAQEDTTTIKNAANHIRHLKNSNLEFKHDFYHYLLNYEDNQTNSKHFYLLIYDLQQDYLQSLNLIYDQVYNHVHNRFSPLSEEQNMALLNLAKDINRYFQLCRQVLEGNLEDNQSRLKSRKNKILLTLEQLIDKQDNGITQGIYSQANSHLMFTLLLEIKDLISVANRFIKLYRRRQNTFLLFGTNNLLQSNKEKDQLVN